MPAHEPCMRRACPYTDLKWNDELKVAVAQTSNWMKMSGWFKKLKMIEEHLNIEKLSTSVTSVVI